MPTTTGMKGGGYYDANSSGQRAALDAFLPWIEESIADMQIPSARFSSISLLDIGSSEGGNAIYAMNRLIKKFRGVTKQPIRVFFADLPTNDFNQMFSALFPDGQSALSSTNVFPGVIGGTAYDRLVPSRSLHIATTFNTIGWLDRKPDAKLPNYILPMGPGPMAPRQKVSVTESEKAPYQRQAADDLYHFYSARAEELVPGGKLLVQVFGKNESYSTSDGIYDVLSDAILDLVDQGLLHPEVYERLIFPIYFRTLEELLFPIKTDAQLSKAFCIEKADSREVSVPFNKTLTETGEISEWARSYTGFMRAFTEAVLASALPGDLPRSDILDKIYWRVEQRLIEDPARYEFHYISIAALLSRV